MRKKIYSHQPWAVTLMELLVVVLIISVLATVATGVYTGEARRARIAAAKDLIHQLEVAITRYEVDTGAYPPSGSGSALTPSGLASRVDGSGYLEMALVHSMSGDAKSPASASWHGPYLNLQAGQISNSSTPGMGNILDPWEMPIRYIQHTDYTYMGSLFGGGTRTFLSTAPTGSNPDLPAPYPYVSETYYNPNTYQLISFGPNRVTMTPLTAPGISVNYAGAEADDVTNFGY